MTPAAVEERPGTPGGPIADEPAFEARGIDYIPVSERRGRPRDLFWMWAGALFNVEYLQVGYETEGLFLVVLAGLALAAKAGVHGSAGLKVGLIIAAAAIQLVLPLLGHGTMLRVLRLLAGPFIVLFILLAILTLPRVHLGAGGGANWETMMIALALVLSAGGYGWMMNANDYSRYLPPDAGRRRIVAAVALGGYIPSTLLGLLGAAVATAVSSATDPISGLPHAFAGWFLIPYLIFVVIQLFAINSIDLYSSGLTLQAIIPSIRRWQTVLVDTVVAGGLTAAAVFSGSFYSFIEDFLLFTIVWIAPWVAIFLVDWLMRRGRYHAASLLSGRRGVYWRHGGFHLPGVIAQLAGMCAAASWLDTTVWQGPLAQATGGADFSVFMGALVGGAVYLLLARRSVAREIPPLADAREGAPASHRGPADP